MATIEKAWARYDALSGKASDQARTLALAGLGAVWLFTRTGEGDLSAVKGTPQGFVLAGSFFAAAIFFDVAHYFIGGEVLRQWIRNREKEGTRRTDDIETSDAVARTPRVFYWLKILSLLAGYAIFGGTVIAAFVA